MSMSMSMFASAMALLVVKVVGSIGATVFVTCMHWFWILGLVSAAREVVCQAS